MINDDRLIYNTLEKWDFGVDGTGNIFNFFNMKHLVDRTKEYFKGDVFLVSYIILLNTIINVCLIYKFSVLVEAYCLLVYHRILLVM